MQCVEVLELWVRHRSWALAWWSAVAPHDCGVLVPGLGQYFHKLLNYLRLQAFICYDRLTPCVYRYQLAPMMKLTRVYC